MEIEKTVSGGVPGGDGWALEHQAVSSESTESSRGMSERSSPTSTTSGRPASAATSQSTPWPPSVPSAIPSSQPSSHPATNHRGSTPKAAGISNLTAPIRDARCQPWLRADYFLGQN